VRAAHTSLPWRFLAFVAAMAMSLADTSLAQSPAEASSQDRPSDSEPLRDRRSEERLAQDWGLQTEEWSRYRQLMRGPLGIYSPNLDPLTALGIEARTDAERERYARLQVRAEGQRTEKLLAYQRAYDQAWRQLYPTLLPISAPSHRASTTSETAPSAGATPERIAVFIKDSCTRCDDRVRELQAAGRAFDIYMVGSQQDDNRVRQWAARVGIDPSKVKAQIITLNHDSGRWLTLGGHGELPAVLTEDDGQWRRD